MDLTEVFLSVLPDGDLVEAERKLAREKVIRHAMEQTGESREIIVEQVDAMSSMDSEAVLDLTEGEPTTLRDALTRYVERFELADPGRDLVLRSVVVDELTILINYRFPIADPTLPDKDHYGVPSGPITPGGWVPGEPDPIGRYVDHEGGSNNVREGGADGPICTPDRRLDHGHTVACGPLVLNSADYSCRPEAPCPAGDHWWSDAPRVPNDTMRAVCSHVGIDVQPGCPNSCIADRPGREPTGLVFDVAAGAEGTHKNCVWPLERCTGHRRRDSTAQCGDVLGDGTCLVHDQHISSCRS